MIPALSLWQTLGPSMRTHMFHEDNPAMIMVVTSGGNPTMRHLGRVHRVCVRLLHERHGDRPGKGKCILFYDDIETMHDDIDTKAFVVTSKWHHVIKFIILFKPEWPKPKCIVGCLKDRDTVSRALEV